MKIADISNIGSCLMVTMDVEYLCRKPVYEEDLEALRCYFNLRAAMVACFAPNYGVCGKNI